MWFKLLSFEDEFPAQGRVLDTSKGVHSQNIIVFILVLYANRLAEKHRTPLNLKTEVSCSKLRFRGVQKLVLELEICPHTEPFRIHNFPGLSVQGWGILCDHYPWCICPTNRAPLVHFPSSQNMGPHCNGIPRPGHFQTCSFWSTYGWQTDGLIPIGMLSC